MITPRMGLLITIESPSHGTIYLDVQSSYRIVFLPSLNFYGEDVFSRIQLDDGSYPSKSAIVLPVNVTINPVNDPPVLSSAPGPGK